jgi:putative ABC transport system permease protein
MPERHDWRADVRARIANAGLHPQDEAEMVEEIAQHLEMQYAELAPHIGAAAARERLLAELRDQAFDEAAGRRRRRARSRPRQVWTSTSMVRDVRYAARSLRRSPGTVAAGVAALALGIGLTTLMYSIIYGLLLKGLPFDEPDRIAVIYRADPTGRGREDLVPLGDFVRYRAQQKSFSTFGGFTVGTVSISGGDRPERIDVGRMTADAFATTGVRPALGRTFSDADNHPDAPPTAVLGYAVWRDRFARDSAVVGQTLRVNGKAHTIIGVMPEGFEFPRSQRLWLPIQADASGLRPGEGPALNIVGRLKADVGYEAANAELAGLAKRLAMENGDTAAVRDLAQPYVRATIPGRVYSLLYTMLAAVLLVLLVACANVANLLLDRAANRSREIGIRAALGASRLAIIRQSLIESAIIAGLAAMVGTALAYVGIVAYNRTTVGAIQADLPFWMDIRLHTPVLVFVLVVATIASLIAGVAPATHSARLDINSVLKDESHAASSLRVGKFSRVIVVVEVALSSALLLAAGFVTTSIVRLRALDPHFATANVFTARVTASPGDTAGQHRLFEELEQQLTSMSGIEGAYVGTGLPGTEWGGATVEIEGRRVERPRDRPITRLLSVSPGFFATFNVPMLAGRAILATDRRETDRVAVISESFARRHFRAGDPLGRRIRLGSDTTHWLTVVGVMPTLFAQTLDTPWPPEVVTALWQQGRITTATIALRGTDAIANAATVRRIVNAIDPEVPVYASSTMQDQLGRTQWPMRVLGTMFVIFGVVSLILGAVGLYAVMSFSVRRRVREMGIRMALGARASDVVRLVCRQGVIQIAIGMTAGLAMGAMIVRLARAALFEVNPSDPTVFLAVAGVLASSGLVACLIPALAATRVDPVAALRAE